MISQEAITGFIDFLVKVATNNLLPVMIFAAFVGAGIRVLVWWTVKREDWFARQFEKRVFRFLDGEGKDSDKKSLSFFVTTKKILERTYYELFEVRAIMKRRKADYVIDWTDRFFVIQMGAARIVSDTLALVKYFKYGKTSQRPKMLEVSKNVFQNNPCFTRVFGWFPTGLLNDILNILPGLFIVGGIFGTFLGIMQALPELSHLDFADVEATQKTMGEFLGKIAFSMSTSIIGIILSVSMNMWNTLFSPEKMFVDSIDRFEGCLDILWNRCNNNKKPEDMEDFDEHKDALEALAEDAVRMQLAKAGPRFSQEDENRDASIEVEEVYGEDIEDEVEDDFEDEEEYEDEEYEKAS